ncbi:hypothetical protein [uncultured Helicobacter sp.]|nr:hypothetical protein [uncultured Helicobacter sp.]
MTRQITQTLKSQDSIQILGIRFPQSVMNLGAPLPAEYICDATISR